MQHHLINTYTVKIVKIANLLFWQKNISRILIHLRQPINFNFIDMKANYTRKQPS